MNRDKFRSDVFERDGHKCVLCGKPAQDAHHILERRLWADGGYHLDNGVSLCGDCHVAAEMTTISVEKIREAAGIRNIILPEHFYKNQRYDKWGNIILDDGSKVRGELFDDESVQKILNKDGFIKYFKYPRTYHLPWSGSKTDDDRTLNSTKMFEGKMVVITEKMDGENTTMYPDHIHARSIYSSDHPSRSWVKNLHAKVRHEIPAGYRICGENLYARHSIKYDALGSYFMVFSIWDGLKCLSWEDTVGWADMIGLKTVPVIYEGTWKEGAAKELAKGIDTDRKEGYVVRLADEFRYRDFKSSVAKYVRRDHVTTHGHWMRSRLVLNGLLK